MMSDNEQTTTGMSRDDIERLVRVESATTTLVDTFKTHEHHDEERHSELKALIVDQSMPGLAAKYPKIAGVIALLIAARVFGVDPMVLLSTVAKALE